MSSRIVGLDVARAVALVGVVLMNYTWFLNLDHRRYPAGGHGPGWLEGLLDPADGPLTSRFAASFVVVAGMSVSRLAANESERRGIDETRWMLRRRGLVLFAGGYALEWIWPGQILMFYGAALAIASFAITWRRRALLWAGAAVMVASMAMRWWLYAGQARGHSYSWLVAVGADSPRNLVFSVVVNGNHPLLPWLAIFFFGICLGRADLTSAVLHRGLLLWGACAAGVGYAIGATRLGARSGFLHWATSTAPRYGTAAYALTAVGGAFLLIGAALHAAERWRHTRAVAMLSLAGSASLSIYVAHALVGNAIRAVAAPHDSLGMLGSTSAALVVWPVLVVLAAWWSRNVGRGPVERLYRRLSA